MTGLHPQRALLPVLWFLILLLTAILAARPGSAPAEVTEAPPAPAPGPAEGTPAIPPDVSRNLSSEDVRALVSRLSDEEVRALLIRQLESVSTGDRAAGPAGRGMVGTFADRLHVMRNRLALMASAAVALPTVGPTLVERLTEGREPSHLLILVLFATIIFAGGFLGEWLFRRLFTRIGSRSDTVFTVRMRDKLSILGLRLLIDLFALATFALCAVGLYFVFYQGHEPTREALSALFWSVLLIRLLAAVGRFALAPATPGLRLPPFDDQTARRIYRRVLLIGGVIIAAVFFSSLIHELGLGEGFELIVDSALMFIVLAPIVGIIWHDREAVAGLIGGGNGDERDDRVRRLAAANWHLFAIAFVVTIGIVSLVQRLLTGQSQSAEIIISLGILAAIPALDGILRALLSTWLGIARPPEAGPDGHADETKVQYRDVLLRNLRIILAVVTVVILAHVWDIDVQSMAARGMGNTLADSLFHIILTLVLASAAWGVVKTTIIQYSRRNVNPGQFEGEVGGQGGTRLQTLLPLFGKFLLVTIIVIVMMILLSNLGVNIGPLIAGAGVVGIAIGFGAQTLVKDILSGVFFLAEDAFRVGEYIETGDVRGTVEHISIRSLRLRHHRGPLHTIPFGEIRHLTNYSRDWAIEKLEVRVPFDTDLEKVRKLIKKVGLDLLKHPEHGPNFLQPVKSQGVNRMDDSALIIRVKFMAKPGEQFVLRREVFRRIQEAFAREGIKFAPRRVIVDGVAGLPAEAVAAAAAGAVATGAEAGSRQTEDDAGSMP